MRVVLIALCAILLAARAAPAQEPPVLDAVALASLELAALPARGTPEKLPVVEITDLGCPACALAHPVMEELLALYGERIEIHYFAIAGPSHPWARPAYAAARCVGEQEPGHFWKAISYFYEKARGIDLESVGGAADEMAANLGADTAAFEACLKEGAYLREIDSNLQRALAVGVRSTPTFIVAGKMIPGARPLEEMRTLVEAALAEPREERGFLDWLR